MVIVMVIVMAHGQGPCHSMPVNSKGILIHIPQGDQPGPSGHQVHWADEA